MRTPVRHPLVATVFAVLCSACAGDDPPLNSPTSLDPVSIVTLTVEGPGRLAPGESAQYTATAFLSNFTTKLVDNVRWIASPPSFLTVDANGRATGGPSNGGAAITAEIKQPDGKTITKSHAVIVLPTNTYFLVGAVTDAEIGVPIGGAHVELASNPSISSTTDGAGFYRLYGVPLSAEIRITAPGYHSLTRTIDLPGDTREDFRLSLSGPRLTLAGNYRLTLDFTGTCSAAPAVADTLRLRQYDAVVTQNGQALQVTLTEPRFLVINGKGNRFGGSVHATGARFELAWDEDFTANVMERLPDGSFLLAYGNAETVATGGGVSGPLFGGISHYGPGFPANIGFLGSCGTGRFTLTPR